MNAEIIRIRKDVTWRDVIRDYVAERSRALDLNGLFILFYIFILLYLYF